MTAQSACLELRPHHGFDGKVRSRSTVLFHVGGDNYSITSCVPFNFVSFADSDNASSALAAWAALRGLAVLSSDITSQTGAFLSVQNCVSSPLYDWEQSTGSCRGFRKAFKYTKSFSLQRPQRCSSKNTVRVYLQVAQACFTKTREGLILF